MSRKKIARKGGEGKERKKKRKRRKRLSFITIV